MPRKQPPKGFMTAKEAQTRLNIGDTMLRRHVTSGELQRYGPAGSKFKPWYKEQEIEALYQSQQVLEEAPIRNLVTSFEVAKEEDMPAILDIDVRTFKDPAASFAVCLSWFHKNPHTFYALKNERGVVVGYASLVPMDKVFIDQFVRDELHGEDITADMVDEYVPGRPLHIYTMALAIDPNITGNRKTIYGSRLITGIFKVLLDLASNGVDIRTITARNYMQKDKLEMPDGLHLLKKMGLTQLKSSVPGVNLFVVNVPESGIPILEKYSKLLEAWKLEHQEGKTA